MMFLSWLSKDVSLTALTAMLGLMIAIFVITSGIDFTVNFLTQAVGVILFGINAYLLVVCYMEYQYGDQEVSYE